MNKRALGGGYSALLSQRPPRLLARLNASKPPQTAKLQQLQAEVKALKGQLQLIEQQVRQAKNDS